MSSHTTVAFQLHNAILPKITYIKLNKSYTLKILRFTYYTIYVLLVFGTDLCINYSTVPEATLQFVT